MRSWRWIGGLVFLAGVALVLIGGSVLASASTGPLEAHPAHAPGSTHRVTICQATGSASNPYVQLTVQVPSNGLAAAGHGDHAADIVPPFNFGDLHYSGMNWTAQGVAIWMNNCQVAPIADAVKAGSPGGQATVGQMGGGSPGESMGLILIATGLMVMGVVVVAARHQP